MVEAPRGRVCRAGVVRAVDDDGGGATGSAVLGEVAVEVTTLTARGAGTRGDRERGAGDAGAGDGGAGDRGAGDRGAGSVLVVAVLAVGCLLAAGAAVVGQAATAAARASSAADLAALAAQDVRWGRVPSGLPPCGAAAAIARAQGAELVRCTTSEEAPGGVVEVEVTITPAGVAARWGSARAVARAGEALPGPP